MAATSSTTHPAGPPSDPSAAPEPATLARPTALAIVRAFGVMVVGPLLLVATAAAAGLHTLRAALAHRPPRPAALGVLAAAYAGLVRPWMRRWGASDADLSRELPGDDACPDPGLEQTHAIAIDAPAEDVWPRIAQLGQDRGGFYSYTFLENLAGRRMRDADRIHPEWQDRRAGDTVLLHPSSGLKILRLDPGRAIVFEGGWALAVEPDGRRRCRLLARFRFPRGAVSVDYALLLELPHFLMERKMLLEIKRRAEAPR